MEKTKRIAILKEKMLSQPRYASIEQALIITKTYQENEDKPVIIKRALSLYNALTQLEIGIEPQELIVGNRTKGVRYGVVFPEAGSSWVNNEIETLPTRPQDKFLVRFEDMKTFREVIYPYWKGKCMEDVLKERYGDEIANIAEVVKINQKDHAQGHICPDVRKWLRLGPDGILKEAQQYVASATNDKADFYQAIIKIMEGVKIFMVRYHDELLEEAKKSENTLWSEDMKECARICKALSERPAQSFHEAVQAIWFLFVVLHMESNASSFSPGRLDKILIDYYEKDCKEGILDEQKALEIIECLWLKFNQIVYLRNQNSAKYFAGFPIGFNIAIGGVDEQGHDYVNPLSHLFLIAQEHLGLPQPNLSLRLHRQSGDEILKHAIQVVAKGSGMPQFFNDESIIPALKAGGISHKDALDYAIVGCVEVTTQGNNLGWSDAAMFNLNKALELTLHHGVCLLTGEQLGLDLGSLSTYTSYEELEFAFQKQIEYFIEKMVKACEQVEKAHIDTLPSAFLSSVIDDCMERGMDVTQGGACYNLSGIQMIQVANLADSLAALKKLVFEEKRLLAKEVEDALQHNFEDAKVVQAILLNKCPKYGNDEEWVDAIGAKWATFFQQQLKNYKNYRGGPYHTGMYTVSAHVPMGEHVGASADGRVAKSPLADGGMSCVYGRDRKGPTAVLKSVSRLDNVLTTNGGLLNMKFLPEFFHTQSGVRKFADFLRTFVDLEIPHIQFNVVRKEDLLAAQQHPDEYRSLTVRVAGYTAYFVELAQELQNEIIARTSYGDL